MSEQLSPEQAVRLLRAKAAELEHFAVGRDYHGPDSFGGLAADISLIAELLADHIEHCGLVVRPGDKLVLTSTDNLTFEEAEQLLQAAKGNMPESDVVVIGGMTATVQRASKIAGEALEVADKLADES